MTTPAADKPTSIELAIVALAHVARGPGPLRVSDLSRELDLPLSTTHRILTTLSESELVAQDTPGGAYAPGVGLRRLLLSVCQAFPLQVAAAPYLTRIVDVTRLSVSLSARVGYYSVRVWGSQRRQYLHTPLLVGDATPLTRGDGLAILAFQDEAYHHRARRFFEEDTGALEETLLNVRRSGCAVVTAEDVTAVSFPIREPHSGRAVAAIVVEGASAVFTPTSTWPEEATCRAIVSEVEALVHRNPSLAQGPFDHLDDESIHFDC